ncbi:MAG: sugar phosphate isomerase/epimerase [Ruminococcaceae bacterium]|nr:sugar phosphate isomerase/epimerase [Oscillospiraceae bacterium]
MKISVFYQHLLDAAAQQEQNIAEMLEFFRKQGVAAAELSMQPLIEDPAIPARLQAAGLAISSIYGACPFASDPNSDAGLRLVDAAVSAGSRLVMPLPGSYSPDIPDEQVRENITIGLSRMVDYAAQAGITVTIEDFDNPRSPINTSAGMLYFGERIPGLCYTYDTGNFYTVEDPHDAFTAIESRLRHVHGKDVTAKPVYAERCFPSITGAPRYSSPFGAGDVDKRTVGADLRRIGYDGYVTTEFFGVRDYKAAILDSIRWLHENWL